MPPRDPLAVAYDGETAAFLAALQTGAPTSSGLYHPRGFISNTGIISVPVILSLPAGGDPGAYYQAFHRSMRYQFRLATYPLNSRGTPAREHRGPGNWAYLRGPYWCVVTPGAVHPTWMRAVVRIGPQDARLGTSPDFASPV